MAATGDAWMSDALDRVRARFVAELQDRFSRVQALRAQIDGRTSPDAPLAEIGRIAHKIAGTAGTLGFPDLGRIAARIDDAVARRSADPLTADPDLTRQIDEMLARMHSVLSRGADAI